MRFLLVAALLGLAVAAPTGKDLAKSLAENTYIRVGVITNHPDPVNDVNCGLIGASWASCCLTYIKLTYSGPTVTAKNWALYFHSTNRVLVGEHESLKLTFLTGDLYKLTPSDGFVSLPAGTWEIKLTIENGNSFETDFFPRYWYEVGDDADTCVIVPNTDTETDQSLFVDPIPGENWKPYATAPTVQSNVSTRYVRDKDLTVLAAEDVEAVIIPTPLKTTRLEGNADISAGINIKATGLSEANIKTVYDRLNDFGVSGRSGYKVTVKVSKSLPKDAAKAEGYKLTVKATGATVVGYDKRGAFYGLQSLVSLVKVGVNTIPCVEVVDAPEYGSREQHIDVARNFHSKEYILKALDQMAAYKINTFHFHLSDDEGWRIEIPGLPELTEVGSKRCHDLTETKCQIPMLGSGPFTNNAGSGFFTRAEYIEILKYANNRLIEVYPEFDWPGHSRAAVVSMEARYRKYLAEGKTAEAEEYRLIDPEDTSMFLTVQYYDKRSQINSCMPGAVPFVRKIITEVVAMHTDAGIPLKKWHFGADEAHNILLGSGFVDKTLPDDQKAGRGQIDMEGLTQPYLKSPVCQEFFKENGMEDGNALIGYLAIEVSKVLNELGVDTFMAWQDGMSGTNASQLATKNAVLNFWDAMFWGGAENEFIWDTRGYQLVLACPDFLYFDFPSENNPKERGYYWAGRDQTIRHLFNFSPANLAQNAETTLDRDGAPYQSTAPALPEGKTVKDVVLGISGQVWSETIRTDEQAEYMQFPRMLALAERAWHKASWELPHVDGRVFNQSTTWVDKAAMEADYLVFSNVLGQRELPKLEASEVRYRVPVPGAVIEDGVLKTNIELPGVPIWYSVDGGDYVKVEGEVEVPADAETCSVAGDYGERMGRADEVPL